MSGAPVWAVLADGLAFPEGPAFAPDGALWCVELKGGSLVRIAEGRKDRIAVGGEPNGLAFDQAGRAWFCDALADAVRCFDPARGSVETMVKGPSFNRPNDLAFGPGGEIVFTCPGNSREEPTGNVWAIARDGVVRCIADELYFPNGLAFVNGGAELVVAETYRQRLWRGVWDGEACRWIQPRPFAEAGGPTGPDGMALDTKETLWVAVFGQKVVKGIASDGRTLAEVETPGRRPTNCAFDPSGRLGLVVTEAERGELLSLDLPATGAPLWMGNRQ